MKSITSTLELVNNIIKSLNRIAKVDAALVGGYSVIAHGVERTTIDADFCVFSEIIHQKSAVVFSELIRQTLPDNFEITLMEGSKIPDDPFKHDIVFVHDKAGEYPRIDFIIAKYKWELEGIQAANLIEGIVIPVIPKPYLIAMKLRAGSPKDDYDIIELHKLLTEAEKAKTVELAKIIHRDEKLKQLLKPKTVTIEEEDESLFILKKKPQ